MIKELQTLGCQAGWGLGGLRTEIKQINESAFWTEESLHPHFHVHKIYNETFIPWKEY